MIEKRDIEREMRIIIKSNGNNWKIMKKIGLEPKTNKVSGSNVRNVKLPLK